jgi:hypothetical protein
MQASQQATVTFTVDHENPVAILHELQQQLDDPGSALLATPNTGISIDHGQVAAIEFVCPPAQRRAVGEPQCADCPGNQIPNAEQAACTECPPGRVPSGDGISCVCDVGSYSVQELPVIQCFQLDYLTSQPEPTTSGCYSCAALECMNCSTEHTIGLRTGYQFVQSEGPVSTPWHAFKCPVAEACPEQVLTSHKLGNSSTRWMTANNCTEGHTGTYLDLRRALCWRDPHMLCWCVPRVRCALCQLPVRLEAWTNGYLQEMFGHE